MGDKKEERRKQKKGRIEEEIMGDIITGFDPAVDAELPEEFFTGWVVNTNLLGAEVEIHFNQEQVARLGNGKKVVIDECEKEFGGLRDLILGFVWGVIVGIILSGFWL